MGYLKSLIFIRNILFYMVSGLYMLFIVAPVGNILALFASKNVIITYLYYTGTGLRKIFQFFIGVTIEYRGLYNIIKGPCIIASKHQSAFETFMLFNKFFPQCVYVIKEEFGKAFFYLALIYRKYDGIKIKREDGIKALIKLEKDALRILKAGRQVVIFPEGTRVKFGEQVKFKRGIDRIYSKSQVPVIPVALNTGATMPKGGLNYPGRIIIEFLPPIQPGLESNIFMEKLESSINKATTALEAETPINLYLINKDK